jgi:hypothetical protein
VRWAIEIGGFLL